jgi:hypothetical protein
LIYETLPSSIRVVLEELQMMYTRLGDLQLMEGRLGEWTDGRCSALEQHVFDIKQHSEEHFVSLEMFRTEAKAERAEMEKQFGGLKLEVGRLNHFMERENLEQHQAKPGIFSTDPTFPSSSSQAEDGAVLCQANPSHRDRAYGSNVPNPRAMGSGMNSSRLPLLGSDSALDPYRARPFGSGSDAF